MLSEASAEIADWPRKLSTRALMAWLDNFRLHNHERDTRQSYSDTFDHLSSRNSKDLGEQSITLDALTHLRMLTFIELCRECWQVQSCKHICREGRAQSIAKYNYLGYLSRVQGF